MRPDSCKIKESECTASDQPFRCSSFELSMAQQTQLELMARKTIRTLEQISNKSPRGVAVFQKFDVE